ncbi:MAG TPA: FtsX-like permease family protein [Ktedonobacteraceae bacterium]|nr:FtsX-like permease family protein [Ktedonobacteraceae bacterium]
MGSATTTEKAPQVEGTRGKRRVGPGLRPLVSGVELASSRWRQQWFLLLLICLGMIASIVIVCAVPLLSETMSTAGLREVLRSTPTSSEITVDASVGGLSSQITREAFQSINPALQHYLGSYLAKTLRSELQTPQFDMLSPAPRNPGDLGIYATSIAQARSHITLLQGRFPSPTSSDVEIAITPETASLLGVHVGSVITLNWLIRATAAAPTGSTYPFAMHVVGIFSVSESDPFWHGYNFLPVPEGPNSPADHYLVLTDEQNLLAAADKIAASKQVDGVFFLKPTLFTWYYRLDPARISINQLDDLINRLAYMQEYMVTNFDDPTALYIPPAYVGSASISGAVFHTTSGQSSMEKFRSQLAVARIPVAILAIQLLALILFFVAMMALLLVDRQADAIAQLRGRGASRSHIFGAFLTQSVGLSLLALIIGLPLAVVTAYLIARQLLPATERDAINVISSNPRQTMASITLYAIAAALVTIIAMMVSLLRASRLDMWSAQQSGAARRPIWQRLNLDLVAIVIALVGYGLSLYLSSVQSVLDSQTQQLVVAPLSLLAPVFLLLAAVLLFLRLFPYLLYAGANLVQRGRDAAPTLAMAQMARTPRQSLRMVLLLALVIAFAIFSLVFTASQAQRAAAIATYLTGADFSGTIPDSEYKLPLPQEIAQYRRVPGVISASAGYEENDLSASNGAGSPIQMVAVDPVTFAQTALWPTTDQGITPAPDTLLKELAAQRNAAVRSGSVPAIVDATTWSEFNLHVGSTFSLYNIEQPGVGIRYVVIGEVPRIPSLSNTTVGGVLADYQALSTIETRDGLFIAPNHIWLRARSDAASLAHVRGTFNSLYLRLTNVYDRYALTESLRTDPAFLNLLAMFAIGVTAALLLALVGTLLTSWLNVRRRLTSFTVLRAMGATPGQISAVLLWEQGIIYAGGLLLGIAFGILLALTAIPALIGGVLPISAILNDLSSSDWQALQQNIPFQFVLPPTLIIAALVLVVVCVLSLVLMVRVVLHPSMSQVLRVDESQSGEYITREDAVLVRSLPHTTASRGSTSTARPSTVTLALWQLRRVWLLWLIEGLGIIAAIAIVCTVPLLSAITTTAELHDVLSATPTTSELTLAAATQGLSTKNLNSVQGQIDPLFQRQLGSYLNASVPFSIQTTGFKLLSPFDKPDEVRLTATSMEQAAPHITLLQGRLPQSTSGGVIEALLTPQTAQRLRVGVGSLLVLRGDFFTTPQQMFGGPNPAPGTITMRVVGIFNLTAANAVFWHGETFQPTSSGQSLLYPLLIPTSSFLSALDTIAAAAHSDTVFSPETFQLTWHYSLDVPHIGVNQINDLGYRLSALQATIQNRYSNAQNAVDANGLLPAPYLVQVSLYNPVPASYDILSTLDQFRNRSAVVSVPTVVLSLQILALILFFIGLLANLVVDWQGDNIAILRSRGASNGQVFIALLAQSLSLCLCALIVGPLLAALIVSFIAQNLPGASGRGLLPPNIGAQARAALETGWYALGMVLAVIVLTLLLLRRASSRNFVSIRQEASRTAQRPLWLRLNLDVVAALIALLGYGVSVYLTSISNLFDTRAQALVSTPVALVAPLFLLIAALLLFLRLFPTLLQLGERLAIRRRGSIAMLALAQIARAPRQALRMTLLLALAIAFAIFTLVFSASQVQHISAIAAYEAGADFSGDLPVTAQHLTTLGETALYHHISGVTSATVGFSGSGTTSGTPAVPMQIRAVDAITFARTAIWTRQDSAQSLHSLMNMLIAARNSGGGGFIPVIIDAATASQLHLTKGSTFTVTMNGLDYNTLNCLVIAEVQHIPTINDSASASSSASSSYGGILLDYTTYAHFYAVGALSSQPQVDPYLPINHVWLRVANNSSALVHVRAALATPAYKLANLYDRQQLIDTMSSDPLSYGLVLLLALGAITALLLTLVGDLLASWLSVRARLTSFAVLRSLGATPIQVTGVLLWEQGIIYVVACLTGILFGLVLALTAVPALTFTSAPAGGILSSLSIDEFYVIQHIIPTQIVIPSSLVFAFLALLLLCALALYLMARTVLHPSASQTLRLNMD